MKVCEKRLDYLLSALMDERLSAEEKKELEDVLLNSKEARSIYRDAMSIHCSLSEGSYQESEADQEDMILVPGKVARKSIEKERSKIVQWVQTFAIAACFVLLLGFVGHQLWFPSSGGKAQGPEKELTEVGFIATIYKISGEVSIDGKEEMWIHQGHDVGVNTLNIENGTISLLFGGGVDVTLQGPAKFEIIDEMNAWLHHGRLLADVPEVGHGFTIHTQEYSVEDLGTKFGMKILEDGSSDVHVLEGKVAFIQKGERKLLDEGEAMSFVNGQVRDVAFRVQDYRRLQEVSQVSYMLPGVVSGPFGNVDTGKILDTDRLTKTESRFQSDQHGFLLEESYNVMLSEPIKVDHNGSSSLFSGEASMIAGELEKGTMVNSYIFRSSLLSKSGSLVTIFTVEFDSKIIGIQSARESLLLTSALLSPTKRVARKSQMSFERSHDRAFIWPDQKTMTIRSGIGGGGTDSLRIITEGK